MRTLDKQVFTKQEWQLLASLNSPRKIQDYLDTLGINFEKGGETLRSPREVMKVGEAHCIEGALMAATALWYHDKSPLLLDLVTSKSDFDHVVALFKVGKHWGALSKTNHAVLRYREPVYKSVRELAMSYFHEYFLDNGKKTLRTYSKPFNLSKIINQAWIISNEDLWDLETALDNSPHIKILTLAQIRNLRLAHPIERLAGKLVEHKK